MDSWRKQLRFNPIKPLLDSGNEAIVFFTKSDLLNEDAGDIEQLWYMEQPQKLLEKQQDDGSWKYRGKKSLQREYNKLETYRTIGWLVEKYGMNRAHVSIQKAAEFLFSFQTDEGDFRGIYGNQYSPNYSAAIMELLIKAGYENDPRIDKGLIWLLSMRQNDGGWAGPLRTHKVDYSVIRDKKTLQPDRSKPFSHLVTGIVLRAFAAHKEYRKRRETVHAAELLASRLFQKDAYPDRADISYWTEFRYPFWWTDILSSLDSLSLIGVTVGNQNVRKALDWFVGKQNKSGIWKVYLLASADDRRFNDLWISLAICRVFKKLYVG